MSKETLKFLWIILLTSLIHILRSSESEVATKTVGDERAMGLEDRRGCDIGPGGAAGGHSCLEMTAVGYTVDEGDGKGLVLVWILLAERGRPRMRGER